MVDPPSAAELWPENQPTPAGEMSRSPPARCCSLYQHTSADKIGMMQSGSTRRRAVGPANLLTMRAARRRAR